MTQHIAARRSRPSLLWLVTIPVAFAIGAGIATLGGSSEGGGAETRVQALPDRASEFEIGRLAAIGAKPLPRPKPRPVETAVAKEPTVEGTVSPAPNPQTYSAPAPESAPAPAPEAPSSGGGGDGGGGGVTIITEPR